MGSSKQVRSAVFAGIAGACTSSAALAGMSSADYVPCMSTEGYGAFIAHVTYSYVGSGDATVTMVLDNTTPIARGGWITAVAVNVDPSATGIGFTSCTNANFAAFASPVTAPPYGSFDAGAGTNSSWAGISGPSLGIAAGSSATFVWSVSGSMAALSALDADTVFDGTGYAMAIRFGGGTDPRDWSDKVIGCATPAPGALALLGVCGLAGASRRRK